MNLLLLGPNELTEGRARLTDRRKDHVRRVLNKAPGDTLKLGVLGSGRGEARVSSLSEEALELELVSLEPVAPPRVHLIVALPRPKGLSRLIQSAASFGVARLDLIGGYRVDKSYFESARLEPARLTEDLWLGCEQGAQVWLPEVVVTPILRAFVDEILPTLQRNEPCRDLLLHPSKARPLALQDAPRLQPARLALGPEGGWTEGELACFDRAGFARISLGPAILRTEIALVAALGQLALLDAWSDSRAELEPAP